MFSCKSRSLNKKSTPKFDRNLKTYQWILFYYSGAMLRFDAQSCLTLCSLMDGSLPGFSARGDCPGKNIGGCCHGLLQGIFLTQGRPLVSQTLPDPGLLHCRQILGHLSCQGSPVVLWLEQESADKCCEQGLNLLGETPWDLESKALTTWPSQLCVHVA